MPNFMTLICCGLIYVGGLFEVSNLHDGPVSKAFGSDPGVEPTEKFPEIREKYF